MQQQIKLGIKCAHLNAVSFRSPFKSRSLCKIHSRLLRLETQNFLLELPPITVIVKNMLFSKWIANLIQPLHMLFLYGNLLQ